MGRLLQVLLSPRAAPVLGVAVLVLTIFLVGTFCGIDPTWLAVAAGAVVVIAFVLLFLKKQSAQKAAGALEAALKAQGQSQAASTRPDQRASIEELKSTFDESLDLLRKSKMGRGALHTIPYYMLIGPPGSGKSTLLRQSGLSFPYMTKGRSAIRGLGGTKNCDWWFADRGILLDTAGRYTTETDDRDEWMAFLRLLKRGRGKRPINGVVVAMGLAELVESTDSELTMHAENIRDRIDELTRELQTVFPIYIVFTKCDRLRGFVETFDTLNKDQRKQVWGFTFPFDRPRDFGLAEQFGNEFDDLYRSLVVRRVDLLASDHFKKRKAQVYAFPLQFLRLKERLQAFLGQLQQPNPYQEVSPVRGIYFTSGTQEGTTIDRILKVLRPAELELDVPEDSRRCYFVDDLFNRVVFDDASLATATVQAQKKDRLLRRAGLAVLAVVALLVVFFRWGAWSEFRAAANTIEANAAASASPEKLREALDAQLAMIEQKNVHIERNGSQPVLEAWYGRKLVEYAQKRISDHADAEAREIAATLDLKQGEKLDDPAVQRRFQAGDERLGKIERGLNALVSRNEAERPAAQALWEAAFDVSPTTLAHFARAFEMKRPSFEFVVSGGSMAMARDKLRQSMEAGDRGDLEKAAAEELKTFFPKAWSHLDGTRTSFGQLREIEPRHWSQSALAAEGKGPLFAKKSGEAGIATVEQIFELLEKDVEAAKARKGAATNKPLLAMAGGGWEQTVARKRGDFLAAVDAAFDLGWQGLLDGLRTVAEAGNEAKGEGRSGHERVDFVPELVNAYHVARATLEAGRPLTDDEHKNALDRGKRVKHDPGTPPWIKSSDTDGSLAASVRRAEAAAKFADVEKERIFSQNWDVSLLNERFRSLEFALVEAGCRREWKACRDDIEKFAKGKQWKSWNQMLSGFPFTPMAGRDASAQEMAAALKDMDELDTVLAQLRPKNAFVPSDEFAKDLEAARALRQILYPGAIVAERPLIEASLDIQKEGAIEDVRLASMDREAFVGKSQWNLGVSETLELQVRLSSGPLSLTGIMVPDLNAVPESWLEGSRLVAGMWGLKRLFALGTVKPERENEHSVTLRLRNSESKVGLYVKTTRPEAAVVFDPKWPGDRYVLAERMWKEP